MEKKKTVADYKDVIDSRILDKLIDIQEQISTNSNLRTQIQSIRAKSQNLNYVDRIRTLNNDL